MEPTVYTATNRKGDVLTVTVAPGLNHSHAWASLLIWSTH